MKKSILALILAIPTIIACASGGGATASVDVSELYTSRLCRGVARAPSVEFLSPGQWRGFLQAQQDRRDLPLEAGGDARIILVNMGEQSTAGYGLRLASRVAQTEAGVLQLSVEWVTPKPGMMLAQMITHPCLVVSVTGTPQRVQVLDLHGVLRISTPGE
jgi:hypothetical protein